MKLRISGITILFAAVIIIGCSADEVEEKEVLQNKTLPPTNEENGENITEVLLSDFFLPNGSKAHYKGEGNEFATLDIEVKIINDLYTVVEENNGGVLLRKIYRLEADRIDLLSGNPINPDEKMPTVAELDNMLPLETYLQKPFVEGTTFGDWEIVKTGVDIETPYNFFQDAIVVQMTDPAFINRRYFVAGFGEVKRESIMIASEGENHIVTSTLEIME